MRFRRGGRSRGRRRGRSRGRRRMSRGRRSVRGLRIGYRM